MRVKLCQLSNEVFINVNTLQKKVNGSNELR